tara:strand:+ start:3259 stop:3441 length:183 start_codon:yes stop_codon:yes gene_type:complete
MTPKEKAIDIHKKMFDIYQHYGIALECALICLDEILDAVITIADKKYDFYTEVKQEINKL